MRGWICFLGVSLMLSACSANEIGNSVYHALEKNKCMEEHGSYGVCARPTPNPP